MLKIPISSEDDQTTADKSERSYKGSSIVDFPDEYVCIDVETTGLNFSDDEIIEVAALHVKAGVVLDKFVSLVKPQRSHAVFSYGTVLELGYHSFADVPYDIFEDYYKTALISDLIEDLTGITNDMLLNAPTEDVVMPHFYDFIGNHILVGHNVNFDINFLYDSCQRCGFVLRNNYIDTLRIARKLLPEIQHHRLSDLAEYFKIVPDGAHRAEADVITTIMCFDALKALVLERWWSIPNFIDWFMSSARVSSAHSREKIYAEKRLRPSDLAAPETVDPSHPLYEKSIVFTGELTMARVDAAQMAADVGAIVKTNVSRKTDFLVVGQQDMTLVGSSGVSGKEKKAKEINDSGKGSIQILSEEDFIKLVGSKTEEGVL